MSRVVLLARQLTKNKSNCRCISLYSENFKQNEINKGNFTPVYKFPYIVPFSLINKLKMYQTALTITTIPGMAILHHLNYVSNGSVQMAITLGISGCITLYSLGYFTNKFVGVIYYNEENDMVKISYIDFWGRRKNLEIPAKDIIPLDDLPTMPMDGLFRTLSRFSSKETLRLNVSLGVVLDKEKIKKIL